MLKKISLEVGTRFVAHYPIRTGPNFDEVKGSITKIYLPASKVEVTADDGKDIWVISLEDAFTKNIYLDRVDD